jgi:anti-anti-sigma factor
MSHSPTDGTSPNRVALAAYNAAVAVVSLCGEHDVGRRQQLRETLEAAATRRPHVFADVSECDFIDSSIVGCLLHAAEQAARRGSRFAVIGPRPGTAAARLFEIMVLDAMVPVYESLEAALASLEHVVRVRDLRTRYGDPDAFAGECSCGWRGEIHNGLLARKRAKADATAHTGGRAVRAHVRATRSRGAW